jgi:hypothetical protein
MPNESGPNEMQNLWCSQPVNPSAMSAEDLRRKAQSLKAKNRRVTSVLAVLMLSAAAGYASFLYFFPGTIQRIGASLTLAGYVYCGYQLRKRGPGTTGPGPLMATTSTYRVQLERQRDFLRTCWRRLLLPIVPGPAVFLMGFLVPELGLATAALLTSAIILPPFAMVIPLVRRKVSQLQRQIDELDALMRRPTS